MLSSTEAASTQHSVDVIASQTCTEVSSKKKITRLHFNWSEQQDDILIPALLDEVVQGGRRSDNGLKVNGFKRVADKIAPLITDATIDVKKAHPKASILRGTRVCHFEKLQIIFGNDQATDEFAIEGNDSVPQTPLEYIDIGLDKSQTVGNGEGECSHENAPRAKGHTDTSPLPLKRRRSLDVFEQFGTALSKMADHIGRLADAFKKEPVKLVLPGVMNALKAIPEHRMGAQPFLVDVFFAMDEENRFEWVKSDLL